MNKKNFLLGLVVLAAGQLAAQEMQFATAHNGLGQVTGFQALANKQKIVFENNAMTVYLKSNETITDVHSVIFRSSEVAGIEAPSAQQAFAVFPNPASTSITVSGVAENTTINLFDLNGLLLQSTTEATINVSSLKTGVYMLQAGERVVKFIKK
ncbi:MAG: T9SS type A sorting domain-containing protein [Prevotellaceae bacterium]|jgi:hypothetical protein|nr:T9SS type A sorting domain-containing protein [Prevotellaceae bacterium]